MKTYSIYMLMIGICLSFMPSLEAQSYVNVRPQQSTRTYDFRGKTARHFPEDVVRLADSSTIVYTPDSIEIHFYYTQYTDSRSNSSYTYQAFDARGLAIEYPRNKLPAPIVPPLRKGREMPTIRLQWNEQKIPQLPTSEPKERFRILQKSQG